MKEENRHPLAVAYRKQIPVIDMGSKKIKCGIAGTETPIVLPNVIAFHENNCGIEEYYGNEGKYSKHKNSMRINQRHTIRNGQPTDIDDW